MQEILFLQGAFSQKIWGGDRLKTEFSYDIPSNNTGEYWAISAMENMESVVTNGICKGENLADLYKNNKELFGNVKDQTFPLLVKIIDAKDDLSIQVHPDDEMGRKLENSRGKTECWYILNKKPSSIIYGLNVKDKDEAIRLIDEKSWDELLKIIPVNFKDFFFVRAGTVHAIRKGALILEIQQASDITYRLYDYDRVDKDGNLRNLHLEKSKKAIKILEDKNQIEEIKNESHKLRRLTDNEYFTVNEKTVYKSADFSKDDPYLLEAVIEGEGEISINDKSYKIKKGDFFILTSYVKEYNIKGDITLVESMPKTRRV